MTKKSNLHALNENMKKTYFNKKTEGDQDYQNFGDEPYDYGRRDGKAKSLIKKRNAAKRNMEKAMQGKINNFLNPDDDDNKSYSTTPNNKNFRDFKTNKIITKNLEKNMYF